MRYKIMNNGEVVEYITATEEFVQACCAALGYTYEEDTENLAGRTMRVSEAMSRADELRPNTLSDEQKAAWVSDLDGQLAEMFGVDIPQNRWPEEDRLLLMGTPHEEIYVLYLVCKIDYYNNEPTAYANDMAMYERALSEALAWYRRNNRPPHRGNWRVM